MATRYKAHEEAQAEKVRYVFAGTQTDTRQEGTKICPRCGQLVFEDMPVCYGCLYDFEKDQPRRPASDIARRVPLATERPGDPLATIELDEIDEEEPLAPPRHRRVAQETANVDDTLDLGSLASQEDPPAGAKPFLLDVVTEDMSVCVPLTPEGISVGRDAANDIVLKARSVSRNHVRLVPDGDGVVVEDCGATNPAFVDGEPLEGSRRLAEGSEVEIGDVILRVALGPTQQVPAR